MNRIETLHAFWSGFGLKAYDENTTPDDAMEVNNGKYLTYDVTDAGWDEDVPMMANLWYRSYSWEEITLKAMEIGDYIGRGGVMIDCDEGSVWIKKAPTFAQRLAHEGYDNIRRIVLSIEVEYIYN